VEVFEYLLAEEQLLEEPADVAYSVQGLVVLLLQQLLTSGRG